MSPSSNIPGNRNAILTISSHVVRGSVGNRASALALEVLGHPVWAVPTIVLPWHPGHGPSTRLRFDAQDFAAALGEIGKARWRGELAGAMTGYFADADQVRAAALLIRSLKDANPGFVYLCDPVIGDRGGLYVSAEVARAVREDLLPLADIATPNRFELGWLADAPVDSNAEISAAAQKIAVPRVVTTSAHAMMADSIANLLVDGGRLSLAEHRALAAAPNGLGDLFSALFLSRIVSGLPAPEALRLAVASVFEIAARSVKAGSDELLLESEMHAIRTPMAAVTTRSLAVPRRRGGGPPDGGV